MGQPQTRALALSLQILFLSKQILCSQLTSYRAVFQFTEWGYALW